MNNKLTGDIKKTLEALQRAGSKGIHSLHLNATVGTTRAAARVNDLINLGYRIDNNGGKKEKMGNSWGVRYTLISSPSPKGEYVFDNETNTAHWVETRQESLL